MKPSEQEILTGIYRKAFPDAVRLVKRMGGTAEEAKDVFHGALLIYLERKASAILNIQASAKAYLIGTSKIIWLQSKNRYFTALPSEIENFMEEEHESDSRNGSLYDYYHCNHCGEVRLPVSLVHEKVEAIISEIKITKQATQLYDS